MVDVEHPRCPFCRDEVQPGAEDAKIACTVCMAWHHKECWDEGRGCSVCGKDTAPSPPATPKIAVAQPPKKGRRCLLACLVLMALLGLGVGGLFYAVTVIAGQEEERRKPIYAASSDMQRVLWELGGTCVGSPFSRQVTSEAYPHGRVLDYAALRARVAVVRESEGGAARIDEYREELALLANASLLKATALDVYLSLQLGDRERAREARGAFEHRPVPPAQQILHEQIPPALKRLEPLLADGAPRVDFEQLALEGVWPWNWKRLVLRRADGVEVQIWPDGAVWRGPKRIGSIESNGELRRAGDDTFESYGSNPGGVDVYSWNGPSFLFLATGPGGDLGISGEPDAKVAGGRVVLGGREWLVIHDDGRIELEGAEWGRVSRRGERLFFDRSDDHLEIALYFAHFRGE